MKPKAATSIAGDARRAFVLNDRPLIVDLIELTLNHGLFVVRSAQNFAEATRILATGARTSPCSTWTTRTAPEVLQRLGASNTLRPSGTPVLGLTRRGDLEDEAPGLRPGGRRHPDDPVLARGAARPLDRHHRRRPRDGPAARAHDHARRDGDRHPQSRGPRGHLGRPPERASSRACCTCSRAGRATSSPARRSSTRSGAPTSSPRATSSIATSGACGSSSRTTIASRGSSRPSRARGTASSRRSRTRAGTRSNPGSSRAPRRGPASTAGAGPGIIDPWTS